MTQPPSEPLEGGAAKQRYDELRKQLEALYAAPAPDMAAIESVLDQLDQAHADFKAAHRRAGDAQKY